MREEEGGSFASEIRNAVRNAFARAVEKVPAVPLDHSPTRRGARLLCRMVALFSPLPKSSPRSLILGGAAQEDMM